MATEGCELLDWDSTFFGLKIARVRPGSVGDIAAAAEWAREERVDCLYCLVDLGDGPAMGAALEVGYRPMDVRVTFERPLPDLVESPPIIELAEASDVAALSAIARVNHTHSRFYRDPGFPTARCDDLYATWIENSCAGWADAVLVARSEGQAVAYISCHLDDHEGRIGLVGVGEGARGQGLGSSLVRGALAWFGGRVSQVSVVTQGANTRAMRLYERHGFVTRSTEQWFHLWPHR